MGSRSPSPEPPEASRGLPEPPEPSRGPPGRVKTVQRAAKSAPRAAKTAPSAAQERFRPAQAPPRSASGAVLPAIWRPTAPQELPGGLQEVILAPSGLDFRPCGGRFARPRPLNVHPSGEHLPLLLGLSTARPPKRKRLENAKITTPPKGRPNNRWPRSPWLTKELGGVGGAIVNTRIHCLKNNGHNKLQAAM